MSDIEKEIREKAKKLLDEEKIKYIIGYEEGSDSFHVSPCFVKNPDDVEKIVWNPRCVNNLVVYLIEDKKKTLERGEERDTCPIGILVKGCDSRSLVQLISEHKIDRDEVVVFGIPCNGVLDPKKLEKIAKQKNIPRGALVEMKIHEENGTYVGEYNGERYEFPREDAIMEKCRDCAYPNPLIADEIFGEEIEAAKKDYTEIEEMEELSVEERWEFWSNQFSKCIRCSACKNVCPSCYCNECAVDPINLVIAPDTSYKEKAEKMRWSDRTVDLSENFLFHLTRMMHMAGRCVDCGECERVCPMDIPLRLLTKKLEKDVKKMFNYEAGIDTDAEPLLTTFEEDDPDEFIK